MQIICTQKRIKKLSGEKLEFVYADHPSFSVPWGMNIGGVMVWGTVDFRVITPEILVKKFEGRKDCWTEEQNGVSYFADFFADDGEPKGVSLEFRDRILNFITPAAERYFNENEKITTDGLKKYIVKSAEYKEMCTKFKSPEYYATEVKDLTVMQVKNQD